MKEIPDTKLLISLHYAFKSASNIALFDLSKKNKARKIYQFEEVTGSKYRFVYSDDYFLL